MAKEFDVCFLGLNGSIDEETAKAIFCGDFDITASQSDYNKMSKTFLPSFFARLRSERAQKR